MNGPEAYSSVSIGARSAWPTAATAVQFSWNRYSPCTNPDRRVYVRVRAAAPGSTEYSAGSRTNRLTALPGAAGPPNRSRLPVMARGLLLARTRSTRPPPRRVRSSVTGRRSWANSPGATWFDSGTDWFWVNVGNAPGVTGTPGLMFGPCVWTMRMFSVSPCP